VHRIHISSFKQANLQGTATSLKITRFSQTSINLSRTVSVFSLKKS